METPLPSTSITRRGLMIALSSPSGAGKTSMARELLAQDDQLTLSISYTTRPQRNGEIDHKDYHFVTQDAFDTLLQESAFLEHAKVFNHYYGTPRDYVETSLAQGKDVLFDIDWQGVQQLAQVARSDLVSIFVLPPSWSELERRLRNRAQDSEEIVQHRMSKASSEMSHWAEYEYVIINHDLSTSVQQAQSILTAERLKRQRQLGLADFVRDLST